MVKRRLLTGYTLTEVMITVAIVGIVSSISATTMIQVNRYFLLTRVRTDLQKEARAAMYVISRSLRQAKSQTITIDRYAATQPFYSRITFTKQQGQTQIFYQNGNQLIMRLGNNATTLSKNVQYLAFTFGRSDDQTIVSVSITLQEAIYQGGKKALHMASEQVQVMD